MAAIKIHGIREKIMIDDHDFEVIAEFEYLGPLNLRKQRYCCKKQTMYYRLWPLKIRSTKIRI